MPKNKHKENSKRALAQQVLLRNAYPAMAGGCVPGRAKQSPCALVWSGGEGARLLCTKERRKEGVKRRRQHSVTLSSSARLLRASVVIQPSLTRWLPSRRAPKSPVHARTHKHVELVRTGPWCVPRKAREIKLGAHPIHFFGLVGRSRALPSPPPTSQHPGRPRRAG